MADIVFVPARTLPPLPPENADFTDPPAARQNLIRGRHSAAATPAPRNSVGHQQPGVRRAASTMPDLVPQQYRPGIRGMHAPGRQDAVADAMHWLGQLRDDDYPEPQAGAGNGAQLGDDSYPSPHDHGYAEPRRSNTYAGPPGERACAAPQPDSGYVTSARPAAPQRKLPVRVAPVWNAGYQPAGSNQPVGKSRGCVLTSASVGITEPAAIGDALRIPIAWCEMGTCISYYSHPQALGEADIRRRAIAVGWRPDQLGRLVCPTCQQRSPRFLATCRAVPWDRQRALAMAALMTEPAAGWR